MQERFDLEQKMREALEQGRFDVFYQPVYDPRKARFTGAEALLRWPDEGGYISPADFIPVAEQSGQIRTLGAMVLMEACKVTKQLGESVGLLVSGSVKESAKLLAYVQ